MEPQQVRRAGDRFRQLNQDQVEALWEENGWDENDVHGGWHVLEVHQDEPEHPDYVPGAPRPLPVPVENWDDDTSQD